MKSNEQFGGFELRTYSKSELARCYFPKAKSNHSAVNMLMTWVAQCRPLQDDLTAIGYRKTTKYLTPREVACFVRHLGVP